MGKVRTFRSALLDILSIVAGLAGMATAIGAAYAANSTEGNTPTVIPSLTAVALGVVALSLATRAGLEANRTEVSTGVARLNASLMDAAERIGTRRPGFAGSESDIYAGGAEFLAMPRKIDYLRAYAPGAFAKRDDRKTIGPKEIWMKAIGEALAEGRITEFLWVIGLPKELDQLEEVLEKISEYIVTPVNSAGKARPQVTISFINDPAAEAGSAGLGFATFDKQAIFLGCAVEGGQGQQKGSPSRLDRAWLWDGDDLARQLASSFADWFDKYGASRTTLLWRTGGKSFQDGCKDAREQAIHWQGLATEPDQATVTPASAPGKVASSVLPSN